MVSKIKDAGLRLRVERELRQEFVAACRAEGRPAAELLREFMRGYVERSRAGQQDLFVVRAGEPLPVPRNKLPRAHAKQRRYRGLRKRS